MRLPLAAVAAGAAVLALVAGAAEAAQPTQPTIGFRVFAHTALYEDTAHAVNGVLWTGEQFLYVENTANTLWSAPAAGMPLQRFASMPKRVEETRCIVSPGSHGFAPGEIYCHSPSDEIYEISADGSSVTVLATLPASRVSDGALAFDDVGRFGYQLVAATGRSGAGRPRGGEVFTISPAGAVRRVGSYTGPGADEIAIAPAGFGSAAGEALLTLDGGPHAGAVVAIDEGGRTRTLATLPGGPNPIAVIPRGPATTRIPAAGLYITNDHNGYVYFAPAAQFARFAGDVIVGLENGAQFWILAPQGDGFATVALRDNLHGSHYGLEGCTYIR